MFNRVFAKPAMAMRLLNRWPVLARSTALLVLIVVTLDPASAQQGAYDAAQVKAAFLYHFSTYVQWPSPAASGDSITIAVMGDDDVARHLAQFLPGRRIEGRAVEVRRVARVLDLTNEEVLFIGSDYNDQLGALTAAVGTRPMLVVTDAENGLDRGGMVNFQLVDSRVRFEVSLRRAEEARLTLSSRLLVAALRVETSRCCFFRQRDDGFPSGPVFVRRISGVAALFAKRSSAHSSTSVSSG